MYKSRYNTVLISRLFLRLYKSVRNDFTYENVKSPIGDKSILCLKLAREKKMFSSMHLGRYTSDCVRKPLNANIYIESNINRRSESEIEILYMRESITFFE